MRRIICHAASAAGESDRSCRRASTMARVSLGVSGTATSADDDGSGNDSDGTTPAPMPAW